MSVLEIEKAIEELKTEVQVSREPATREYAAEVEAIIHAFEAIRTELLLDPPNLDTLYALLAQAQSSQNAIARKMIDAMRSGWVPLPFGSAHGAAKFKEVFAALTSEILEVARRRTAEFHALASANGRGNAAQVTPGNVDGHFVLEDSSDLRYGEPTSIIDVSDSLTNATATLGKFLSVHPEMKEHLHPVLEQLLNLSLRAVAERRRFGGSPPRGPVDTPNEPDDDGDMEPRIVNLEKFVEECRKDLRSIDVRLAKVETLADGIAKNMATKAELAELKGGLAQLEATLLKWFIGTAIALTGLAFGAAKLLH
jgi:hypothetical protein